MSTELDKRISSLIKLSNYNNHRGCFVLIGENSINNVSILCNILSFNSTSACDSILWCHQNGKTEKAINERNLLVDFNSSKDIQFVKYDESSKILGQTVDILILHDFEYATPNTTALSMETVRGGGIVILLLDEASSIDVMINKKSEFIVDDDYIPRYNKRLFMSLVNSSFTIFLDENMNILPCTRFNESFTDKLKVKTHERQLFENTNLIENSEDIILKMAKTDDQSHIIKNLLQAIKSRTDRSIYSIRADRGRGKSVTLGLAVANAIELKYASIYLSAPVLENLKMVFEFILKGLEAIGYKKYKDFKIFYSFKSKKRLINRIEILRNMKQTVEFFNPFDDLKYYPDMFIIDEAAAIPLPILKKMLFPNLIIMATTTSGYEGTGKAFSTKMAEYLRTQSDSDNPFKYKEFAMKTSIRYGQHDPVEKWLNKTFLLDVVPEKIERCPLPSDCYLYYVDKDVLFSGNSHTENILKEVYSLFVASHYKNSPNDIQILADSYNHEIFTLLSLADEENPRVLCAIHVVFEGNCINSISKKGNLIPWIVSETYYDKELLKYLGVRVVRISVHPDYMSMGYGSRALDLLINILTKNQITCLSRLRYPSESDNVVFHELSEVYIPKIHWVGTSFGVSDRLLNFWKKQSLIPICIKQKVSYVTGEHTIILLKSLETGLDILVQKYYRYFKIRFVGQLPYTLNNISSSLCLTLIHNKMTVPCLQDIFIPEEDVDRLARYCKGSLDFFQMIDLMPLIARLYFTEKLEVNLSFLQKSVFLMIGCQNKTINEVATNHSLKVYEVESVLMKLLSVILESLIN